jgi:hypothetical protein
MPNTDSRGETLRDAGAIAHLSIDARLNLSSVELLSCSDRHFQNLVIELGNPVSPGLVFAKLWFRHNAKNLLLERRDLLIEQYHQFVFEIGGWHTSVYQRRHECPSD